MLMASERMNSVSQSFGERSIKCALVVTVACVCDRKHGAAGGAVKYCEGASEGQGADSWLVLLVDVEDEPIVIIYTEINDSLRQVNHVSTR